MTVLLSPLPAHAQTEFAGTWQLNRTASHLVGPSVTIQRTAQGYRFDFGATSFVVGDDGRDYPTVPTRTTSIKPTGERVWLRRHKVNGKEVDRSTLTISADGSTMTIHTIATDDTGAEHAADETMHRTTPGDGLAGRWQSDAAGVNVTETYVVADEGKSELRWESPGDGQVFTAKPDGGAVAVGGARSVPGITVALRSVSLKELHWTVFIQGKPYTEGIDALSADSQHMTETTWPVQTPTEKQEAVYDRK